MGGPATSGSPPTHHVTAMRGGDSFFLEDSVTLILGPDETVQGPVAEIGPPLLRVDDRLLARMGAPPGHPLRMAGRRHPRRHHARTSTRSRIPGAIVAAMTTSIPEAPDSGRNWDYRYCWIRDAYFVVDALNRLGGTRTMERYLAYILNIVAGAEDGRLQPMYGISGRSAIAEQQIDSLPGYRGMGPVRVGNQAYQQVQHDVYGSAILAATHVFFDRRLVTAWRRGAVPSPRGPGGARRQALRPAGRRHLGASRRGPACTPFERDLLGRVRPAGAHRGAPRADGSRRLLARGGVAPAPEISARCWNPTLGSFAGTMGGESLDASLLLLHEVGFLAAERPALCRHRAAVGQQLRHGDFIYRYVEQDDFGHPATAFLICTFWYIDALAALGRRDEARALFETCWRAGTRTACWPRTFTLRRVSSGEISCRLTAWSG